MSGEFTVQCDPRITVEDFFAKVKAHPKNKQMRDGPPRLKPHDPSKLGRRGEQNKIIAEPNCVFRQENPKATIAEAGLVDGAVLEQPEQMKRD